jgi:hypothetical protein
MICLLAKERDAKALESTENVLLEAHQKVRLKKFKPH